MGDDELENPLKMERERGDVVRGGRELCRRSSARCIDPRARRSHRALRSSLPRPQVPPSILQEYSESGRRVAAAQSSRQPCRPRPRQASSVSPR